MTTPIPSPLPQLNSYQKCAQCLRVISVEEIGISRLRRTATGIEWDRYCVQCTLPPLPPFRSPRRIFSA